MDFNGVINKWGKKTEIIALPIISTIVNIVTITIVFGLNNGATLFLLNKNNTESINKISAKYLLILAYIVSLIFLGMEVSFTYKSIIH